jgi:hypothetical protein
MLVLLAVVGVEVLVDQRHALPQVEVQQQRQHLMPTTKIMVGQDKYLVVCWEGVNPRQRLNWSYGWRMRYGHYHGGDVVLRMNVPILND